MRKKCEVCEGVGTVPQSRKERVLFVSEWPREPCQNCAGTGWVGRPEVVSVVDGLIDSITPEAK